MPRRRGMNAGRSMASETNDVKSDGSGSSGLGCGGWLGLLILILVAAAVIFYFVVKPRLEERGVDVDTRLEQLGEGAKAAGNKAAEAVKTGYDKVRTEAPALLDTAKEKAADGYRSAREGAAQTVDAVSEKTQEGKDKVESWY